MISFGTCERIGRRQESSVNEAPKKSEHPHRRWVAARRRLLHRLKVLQQAELLEVHVVVHHLEHLHPQLPLEQPL